MKIQYETKPRLKKNSSYGFKIGDLVRLSYIRRPFQREYDEWWSRELFVINERFMSEGIPQYRLKDYTGEIVSGVFYQKQLTKAYEQETYLVDELLKSRNQGRKKEFLVQWKGWPLKFYSWISEDDLKSLKGSASINTTS